MEKIKPTILGLRISAQIFSRFLLVFSIIYNKGVLKNEKT